MISSIDEGFGVNVFTVDEYYISQRPAYHSDHFIHEILIYGYCKRSKKLFVVGYDKKGVFGKLEYDFDEFVLAYTKGEENAPLYLVDSLQLIRVRNFFKPYQFKLERFNAELGKYLFSIEDDNKLFWTLSSKDEAKYGITTFQYMSKLMINYDYENPLIYKISIYIFDEHKRNILYRLNFIKKKYELEDSKTLEADYKEMWYLHTHFV